MGVFGKILLVLNLLLIGGFVYLGIQDYQGRQSITAAGLRHLILLNGLPFEDKGPEQFPARVQPSSEGYSDFTGTEIPFVVLGPGNVPTTTVSPELLYKYFDAVGDANPNSIGGNMPVASQIAEIKRVFGILKSQDDAARAAFITPALLRLAETFEERSDYVDWAAKGNVAELTHALDLKFHRVIPKVVEAGPLNPTLWGTLDARVKELEAQRDAAQKAAQDADAAGNAAEAELKRAEMGLAVNRIARRQKLDDKRMDESNRRFLLATLLAHMDTRPEWQKRTAMIVGIKQYVKAIDGQAGKYREIADRVEEAMLKDQERFLARYTQLRAMAIQRTQLMLEMAELRTQLTIQAQKDQDLVNQRKLQRDDLNAQLATLRTEVNTLLAKQTLTEQVLFLVEREIGLKLEDIYRMEDELRKRELERYGQK